MLIIIKNMPSWSDLLNELQHPDSSGQQLNLDTLRRKYLGLLHKKTGRNVIVYFSGWLEGRTTKIDINDIDMTGFMTTIKDLDFEKGLDLILHTPGGNPTATEGIVNYLHSIFGNNIRVIVPQMAMSAGTMLSCSSKEIIMGKHSCLGPVDPQFNGIPAFNILKEFNDAKNDLIKNPETSSFWKLQLSKYPAAFLYSVTDAIALSDQLLKDWLDKYMFSNLKAEDKKTKIKKIIKALNSNMNSKSHSRHYSFEKCKEIGLNVSALESDNEFQDLVLSVFHAFTITINSTQTSKIIENHLGKAYINFQTNTKK